MRYYYDFIWHYFVANSRHGTHSPFVYKMADEVIYKSEDRALRGEGERSSEYLISEIQRFYSDARSIVVPDIRSLSVEEVLSLQKEYDFIFLNNIYKGNGNKQKWSALVADPNVIVSIDLFYFGIIIPRKEQPKENFRLRFPFFKY